MREPQRCAPGGLGAASTSEGCDLALLLAIALLVAVLLGCRVDVADVLQPAGRGASARHGHPPQGTPTRCPGASPSAMPRARQATHSAAGLCTALPACDRPQRETEAWRGGPSASPAVPGLWYLLASRVSWRLLCFLRGERRSEWCPGVAASPPCSTLLSALGTARPRGPPGPAAPAEDVSPPQRPTCAS